MDLLDTIIHPCNVDDIDETLVDLLKDRVNRIKSMIYISWVIDLFAANPRIAHVTLRMSDVLRKGALDNDTINLDVDFADAEGIPVEIFWDGDSIFAAGNTLLNDSTLEDAGLIVGPNIDYRFFYQSRFSTERSRLQALYDWGFETIVLSRGAMKSLIETPANQRSLDYIAECIGVNFGAPLFPDVSQRTTLSGVMTVEDIQHAGFSHDGIELSEPSQLSL